ncbi:nitrile hydratase accessory protein [Curvivirga sp.]|uniref:nitrile hydratase accessory protein n=1 Tax=Curvivirga sp. TaxID=2856848 RepID=UPI003B5944B8
MSDAQQNICLNMPLLPKDEEGPVFAEPWQAQAFAMAVKLCEDGYFTWQEWVEEFSQQIKKAQAAGDPDLGDTYYLHWINCLEEMVASKNMVSLGDMQSRKEQWRQAYLDTPHGEPVSL